MAGPLSLDDAHGATAVAGIQILMFRSGMMEIAGSLTDEASSLAMLRTAEDWVKSYHAKQKLGLRSPIIVRACDTALVGTNTEKELLAARHDLANAMAGT